MAGASSSCPPSAPSLLAAAAALKGILECMDAERALRASDKEEEEEQRKTSYQTLLPYQSHESDQRLHGDDDPPSFRAAAKLKFKEQSSHLHQQRPSHARGALLLPSNSGEQALALPREARSHSRRPGRPFRKRAKRWSSEEYHRGTDASNNRENLLPLTKASFRGEALAREASAGVSSGHGTPAADRGGRPRGSELQQRQDSASTKSAPLSVLAGRQQRPCYPPVIFGNSTTRILSSETYLRRLFVTASLAHVLSLDVYLPRSMAAKRAASLRGAGGGGGGGGGAAAVAAGCDNVSGRVPCEGERASPPCEGSGGSDVDGRREARRDREQSDPPSSHHGDDIGPFKKHCPVTLVDSAGRRWNMTYETTRRDNLHSGRLIDGWEAFCCANGLRVGDQVEFTKLEAPDCEGGGHKGRGAVASIAAYRKHARSRYFGV